MRVFGKISWGDLFTLANGILGFVAITFILDRTFLAATSLLFLSMMMDGLDGIMARRFGSKHSLGQVLDSISDAISFAFAPALLVYAEFHTPEADLVQTGASLLCAIALLATGLFRLARFSASGYHLEYFVGMPAPAAALVVVLMCLLFGSSEGTEAGKFYYVFSTVPWLVLAFGFGVSFLMASEIPYPKIRGRMAIVSGVAILLAVLPAVAGLAIVGDQTLYNAFSRTATSIALALTLVYVFGGPLYENHERAESG